MPFSSVSAVDCDQVIVFWDEKNLTKFSFSKRRSITYFVAHKIYVIDTYAWYYKHLLTMLSMVINTIYFTDLLSPMINSKN